jgi:hypothetical protein
MQNTTIVLYVYSLIIIKKNKKKVTLETLAKAKV